MNREKKKLEECFCKGTINDETLTKANAILVIKCADLEQKVKKQKKVIDKAIEYINSPDISIDIRKADGSLDYVSINELLNILKEVR